MRPWLLSFGLFLWSACADASMDANHSMIEALSSEIGRWATAAGETDQRFRRVSAQIEASQEMGSYIHAQLELMRPQLLHVYRKWRSKAYKDKFRLPWDTAVFPLKWTEHKAFERNTLAWGRLQQQRVKTERKINALKGIQIQLKAVKEKQDAAQMELESRFELMKRALLASQSKQIQRNLALSLMQKLSQCLKQQAMCQALRGKFALPVLGFALEPDFIRGTFYLRFFTESQEPIAAVSSGNVEYKEDGDGLPVRLRTETGEIFVYKGLGKPLVGSGVWVNRGDTIALAPQSVSRRTLSLLKQNEDGLVTILTKDDFFPWVTKE